MPAKKKSSFGRNTPFGSRSPLTVAQRKAIPDIDTGKMSKTVKSGGQMSAKERRDYVSKVKAQLQREKDKKKPSGRTGAAKNVGKVRDKHNTYYK